MGKTNEESNATARDIVLGRLAIIGALGRSVESLADECVGLFLDIDDDTEGKKRAELLEAIDDVAGELAIAVQKAQGALEDVDPLEVDDDEEEDDDDEEDEEDEEVE